MYLDFHCLWPAVAGDHTYWMTSQRIVQVSMSTLPAANFVPFALNPSPSEVPRCPWNLGAPPNSTTMLPSALPCVRALLRGPMLPRVSLVQFLYALCVCLFP